MALELPGVLFCDKKQTWMKFMIVCSKENTVPGVYMEAWGRPAAVMTLSDYGYLPPEFLKSYPVSE